MTVVENPNRFSLPVETFIRQYLAEQYPKLNTAPGSAVYDLVITPIALIQQQFRDRMRVIQRNQSLRNFSTMLPEELDRLAANFLISKREGERARGVQRIYFSEIQDVNVSASARFADDEGREYLPISDVTADSLTLSASLDQQTGEYFIDVPTIAAAIGSDYRAKAGKVSRVINVLGATRTTNPFDYSGGAFAESNGELYGRIKKSFSSTGTSRSASLTSLILRTFPTVTDVVIQGYGDPLMLRDTATVVLSTDRLFQASFAQKVNLPLDMTGKVMWEDSAGNAIVAPTGGYVGAVYDLLDKDFNALKVSLDGKVFGEVSVQPGFGVRFLDENSPDFGTHFIVTKVETVPTSVGGVPVKVLRLDRPLSQTGEVTSPLDGAEYTIIGDINTSTFHIGGKTDIYVKSISDTDQAVVISALPAVASSDVAEVPLTSSLLVNNVELFENSIGFAAPIIAIAKVEQLAVDSDRVIRVLIPDVHYSLIRKEARGQFTLTTSDVLRIEGYEEIDGSRIPLFIGERIKVTYTTNSDIPLIESFINSPTNRDVTKDTRVLGPDVVFIDVEMTYAGARTTQEMSDIISRYITKKGFGASLTVNELITLLGYFGVTDITMPVRLSALITNKDGTFTTTVSEDRVILNQIQTFKPVPVLSLTKR